MKWRTLKAVFFLYILQITLDLYLNNLMLVQIILSCHWFHINHWLHIMNILDYFISMISKNPILIIHLNYLYNSHLNSIIHLNLEGLFHVLLISMILLFYHHHFLNVNDLINAMPLNFLIFLMLLPSIILLL